MILNLSKFVLALTGALLLVLPALAQTPQNNQEIRSRLQTIGSVFEYVDGGITPRSRRSELARLRDAIEPLRNEVGQIIEGLEPRFAELETRVKALGPAPAKDAPAEEANLADQRKQLGAQQGEIDGLLKQARVLATRGDQLAARIEEVRRARLADRLFERTMSILDPKLWLGAAEAAPGEVRALVMHSREWFATVSAYPGVEQSALVAALMCFVAVFGIFFAQHWLTRYFSLSNGHPKDVALPRLRRAKSAVRDSILGAIALPLAFYVVIEILSSFEFLIERAHQSALGILAAVTLYAVGRALAGALLRPKDFPRRLLSIRNDTAARFYSYATYGLLIAATGASLNIIHRSLGAPRIMITATSALMAGLIAVIIIRTLLKTRQAVVDGTEEPAPNWLRLVLWIVAIVILGSVLTGYVWLASFLTSRLVHAAIVIACTYVILHLINAYFDEGLQAHTQRGRSFASTVGIRTQSLELAAALFAGAARVLVFIVALFLIIGNWGTSLTDLAASFERASFGIELGKLHLSLYDIGGAIGVLIIGVYLSRILQRWLANTVLPRTGLDTSLKNSIATIAGYIGVIAAISIALGRLGLNLENIALVAGALSVGIGFGLQAIVSNFVSGLILLTERPIKVGDMVNVKGNEGYVRRISVRSTEVETYDRASVIIPNSELITNAVTNWTHTNQIARISVKVGVAYDSDAEKVRDILIAEALRHPRVLQEPPPVVFFMEFGDSALNMELRCVVNSANFMLSTRSDLNFSILKAFRENGIDIPFPQQDMRIIDPTGLLGGNARGNNSNAPETGLTPDGPASKR
ncbi:MAG: mechanosensitive ion channel family protein [Rhizobiales bacterium]|nr:mechanosensitive ion channel family protein [Hyphomicrobiales bacterium]